MILYVIDQSIFWSAHEMPKQKNSIFLSCVFFPSRETLQVPASKCDDVVTLHATQELRKIEKDICENLVFVKNKENKVG